MDNFRHYQKMRNDNHNYADSLYVLYVFLRKAGLNKNDDYGSIEYLAREISDDMRAVRISLDQLEQYRNGNPNKYSKQHLVDGLGTVIRYLKNTIKELHAFDYKNEFVHINELHRNYLELLEAMDYWERTIKND